jgi:hypothetical protein
MINLFNWVQSLNSFFTLSAGGGGGGQSTVSQVTIPKELIPYIKESIEGAQDVKDLPFVAYDKQRIAGLTPQQRQAMSGVMGLRTPEQFAAATRGAQGTAGLGFDTAQQGLSKALGYSPDQFYAQQAMSPQLRQYQMSPAERATSATFNQRAAQQYMSPYQQNVTDIAAREMQRQNQITQKAANLGSAAQGTYGGARQALLQAERESNLGQNMSDLYAKGQQAAFENAQKQFEADQQRRAAAQGLNINAGLTTGRANLDALLGVQSQGSQQNLQAQLANQQAGLEAQKARAQANQYGAGLGAQVGTAGLNTAMQGAQTLGQLGQAQQEANLARLQAQMGVGDKAQQQNQAVLSQRYQDFLEQRGYPKEQASWFSNIVRGLPIAPASTTTQTAPGPSLLSQLGGLGIAGLGLYNMSGRG